MCQCGCKPMISTYPRLVLGLATDSFCYPPTPSGRPSAAGEAVVGPMQFVACLELALGLGGPPMPSARRIAAWRRKLAAAGTERFWKKSFAADGFATARLLLSWRDSLVEAGWSPGRMTNAPKRLAELELAESLGGSMPFGFSDRLCAVIAALSETRKIVDVVELIEPRRLLPSGLTRLINALESCGTTVVELPQPSTSAAGDLGRVQSMLRTGANDRLIGDDRFALMTASSEIAAAEALADWLSVTTVSGSMILVADRETTALDAALRRRGLPPIGRSENSAQRGLLQVLPLVFAIRWAPFDAHRMLEFLQLQQVPLPSAVRRNLIKALREAPGRDGASWNKAIEDGTPSDGPEGLETDNQTKTKNKRGRKQIECLLQAPLLDPKQGISLQEVRTLCSLVSEWAGLRIETDPLAVQLASAAKALAEAADTTSLDTIPRLDLERLIEQVMEDGSPDPLRTCAASPWTVVHEPGAIWGAYETLVWWGVTSPPQPQRSPWTKSEAAALDDAQCAPSDPETALLAATSAWRNAISYARQNVLLVAAPNPSSGNEVEHPLLQELALLLEKAPERCRPVAETLLADNQAVLLGTKLRRAQENVIKLPQPRATWHIPKSDRRAIYKQSASSVLQLLGCPYAWVAKYAASLRPGSQAKLPSTDQMVGTLAHALIEQIFKNHSDLDPDKVEAEARLLLPRLIKTMAAPLLTYGQGAEHNRVINSLPTAARSLAELLCKHGLSVHALESDYDESDMPTDGVSFGGRIDLVLKNSADKLVVLDLKWSSTDRYYQEAIEEGTAVQLAAYAQLVKSGEAAAYFMLAQGRVVGCENAVPGGSIQGAPTLNDTWSRTADSFNLRHNSIASGTLHATGLLSDVPDPDGISISIKAPCKYCDYQRLCGKDPVR